VRSTLDELSRELDELRALVASISPVNLALSEHPDSLVRQYVSIRRRFDNAAFIVALYASFEKFIENLIAAYIEIESRRLPYSELPQKLVIKHLQRSAELLWRGRLGDGRYAGLSEMGIIKNLFECLNGSRPYLLNEVAVVAHDSNLRAKEVDELFAAVGIEKICDLVRRADELGEWFSASNGFEDVPQDGVKRAVIEERLRDIVERRNQSAHRGGSPVDLLGSDAMSDAIGFIEGLSKSIFAVIVGRYLSSHYAETSLCVVLEQRQGDGPFKNGTIVVVEQPEQQLFVGQPVFVITEPFTRWGRIESLRLDDASVQVVDPGNAAPQGVGIGLSFRCPKGAKLFALSVDDDVVWHPLVSA